MPTKEKNSFFVSICDPTIPNICQAKKPTKGT
jgi:hypothetical protein